MLIQDEAELDRWIARATEAGQVAVDTETTSLDAIRAELVGVSLAIEPGEGAYVPLAHVKPGAARTEGELALAGTAERVAGQLDRDHALAKLKPMLEDPSVLKIGHNIKYDVCIFSTYDVHVSPVDDTMLISYVLEGGAHGHGMDELANLHLGHKTITYDEVTGTGKNRPRFRRGGARQGARLRGRGCRGDVAAASPAQAAADRRAPDQGLRDHRAAARAHHCGDGMPWREGRSRGAAPALQRSRPSPRGARGSHPQGGGPRLQHRLAGAARHHSCSTK